MRQLDFALKTQHTLHNRLKIQKLLANQMANNDYYQRLSTTLHEKLASLPTPSHEEFHFSPPSPPPSPPQTTTPPEEEEEQKSCESVYYDCIELPAPRIARSSSLRTGKTPPGTPARKKIVRFADVLGLDLADVKIFLGEELPDVPRSAFRDLIRRDIIDVVEKKIILSFNFHQPITLPSFFEALTERKVLLESCHQGSSPPKNHHIIGTVRVCNLDFHKSVYIRYTYDEWNSFAEFLATYIPCSCNGPTDRFSFDLLLAPEKVVVGQRISFCIRFHCCGHLFWDNNQGRNYQVVVC